MVARYERQIIEDLLYSYGDRTGAKRDIAKKLNISQATLYRKLKELDLTN